MLHRWRFSSLSLCCCASSTHSLIERALYSYEWYVQLGISEIGEGIHIVCIKHISASCSQMFLEPATWMRKMANFTYSHARDHWRNEQWGCVLYQKLSRNFQHEHATYMSAGSLKSPYWTLSQSNTFIISDSLNFQLKRVHFTLKTII